MLTRQSRRTACLLVAALCLALVSAAVAATAPKGTARTESVRSSAYGELTLRSVVPATEKDLGMPLYPGAKVARSYRHAATEKQGGKPAGFLAQAVLVTDDTPATVVAFYRKKLGAKVGVDSKKQGETFLHLTRGVDTLTVSVSSKPFTPADAKVGSTHIKLSRASKVKAAAKQPSRTRPSQSRRGQATEV